MVVESMIFLFYGREYREVSFSVGGQTTWREVVTLPNILKIFNPNLYGASE
jgi:phospholipase B1